MLVCRARLGQDSRAVPLLPHTPARTHADDTPVAADSCRTPPPGDKRCRQPRQYLCHRAERKCDHKECYFELKPERI